MNSCRCCAVAVAVLAVAVALPAGAGELTPEEIFGKLKSMEGSWDAHAEALEGEEAAAEAEEKMVGTHDFRVSANGSVVMEVMSPGTEHEMINMYHMNGDDLMLTHYCSSGNQPVMTLDRDGLSEGKVAFDFVGGTNLDPAVDMHIHSTSFEFREDGSMVADWIGWSGGEQAGVMRFELIRSE